MPSVLTCRHQDKSLLEGGLDGLDPRIASYITDAGLDGEEIQLVINDGLKLV